MKGVIFSRTVCMAFAVFCGSALHAYGKKNQLPSESSPPAPLSLVTMGDRNYTFSVDFAGLALQPFAANLEYGAEALPFNYGDALPAVSPSWVIPQIETDFHFGFDLGLSGVFHSANAVLMANWERYHTSGDSSTLSVGSVNNMVGPFFEIGPDASPYKKATGTVSFHFDEVNLDYGAFVQFGKLLRVNLFGGVGFARLVQKRSAMFSNLEETIVRTIDVPAKFTGAGPQAGLFFQSEIFKGFQLVGSGRGTLFVGTFENSTTYTTRSQALVDTGSQNPNVQTTQVENNGGVVPGLEGKLGLMYEYLFCGHYLFKIEAGYQGQIYLNALRSVDLGSEVALSAAGSVGSATTGVYARTFQRTISDFGLAGPYAAVSFGF